MKLRTSQQVEFLVALLSGELFPAPPSALLNLFPYVVKVRAAHTLILACHASPPIRMTNVCSSRSHYKLCLGLC